MYPNRTYDKGGAPLTTFIVWQQPDCNKLLLNLYVPSILHMTSNMWVLNIFFMCACGTLNIVFGVTHPSCLTQY